MRLDHTALSEQKELSMLYTQQTGKLNFDLLLKKQLPTAGLLTGRRPGLTTDLSLTFDEKYLLMLFV